jgi:disease resistance protein RPM1
MKHLENLNISTIAEDEIIDLNFISSPPQLQRLHLKGRLQKLPDWIPKLECLVKVRLSFSMLKDDPLQSLKNLPNLLKLCLWYNCYDGEIFHFQNRGFLKLRTLNLGFFNRVNSIIIDNGTLLSLEHLTLENIPRLKKLPSGIKPMHKLKDICFTDMPAEFVESIDQDKGKDYSIIKHVPLVFTRHWYGPNLFDYDFHPIHSSSKVL